MKQDRLILVEWRRGGKVWRGRLYTCLSKAFRRSTELAYIEGKTGDMLVYSSTITGKELGFTAVGTKRIRTEWTHLSPELGGR